ncbi:MAG: hypothetical protein IKR74_02450 [Bacilli bacterium]|nr:hypothetical protein [Bacilli bacterium]
MTRRKKKRVVNFFKIIVTIVIVGVIIFIFYTKYPFKNNHKVDDIRGYHYAIENRDSKLMKDNFALLKDVLLSQEIDYEKYAEYLSKLFVIDLYTLSNKNNKYDIGGTEYVYPDNVNSYKLKAQDTLYKYLENKDERKQNLPTVSEISLDSIEETTYKYKDKEYAAYRITLSWKYTKDYGYDTQADLVIMKDNKFLYVVEFNTEVES